MHLFDENENRFLYSGSAGPCQKGDSFFLDSYPDYVTERVLEGRYGFHILVSIIFSYRPILIIYETVLKLLPVAF